MDMVRRKSHNSVTYFGRLFLRFLILVHLSAQNLHLEVCGHNDQRNEARDDETQLPVVD